MKLLPRLVLTTLLVGAPLLAAVAWSQQHARDRAVEESMAQLAQWFMQSGGRAACEAAPHSWMGTPGPHHHQRRPVEPGRECPPGQSCPDMGPPPHLAGGWSDGPLGTPPFAGPAVARPMAPFELRIFAYDTAFVSQNANAPLLANGLPTRLASDATCVAEGHASDGDEMRVLVRMPWTEGPCAMVLVTRQDTHQRSHLPMPLQALLVPPALALVSLLLAIGPVVRRMRRLTEEVKRAASAHYTLTVPVEGKDEVGELAHAFNHAGKQIREYISEQARREKTLRDFLENTTHDVMIPLTVLQGHLSRLQEQAAQGSITDAPVVQSASQEAHYIASLVHNLSIAAKLEAGEPQVQRQPVNLNEVVQRAVARHQPVARQRDISVEFAVPERPVWVEGDVTLIEQALSNVVYNAVRYNRPQGHVAVLLNAADGGMLLRVVDDGPGMDDADTSRVMERYVRGNSARSRTPHGQGLGLNIAYRVCVAHGWDITLQRSEFGGLQVEFRVAK